jgi:hypothetical protein
MLREMKHSGLALAALAAAAWMGAGVAQAVHFVPPADGPVPFHRDQVPIDVNTMSTLSRQLVTLAGAQKADDLASLQTVARLLALARALDPQNHEAEDLVERLKEKKPSQPADAQTVDRATNRAWQIESWLDSADAGQEGKALAKCLLDVMAAVDPAHPKAAAVRTGGLQGAWEHWVAPASEFEDQAVVKNDTPKPPPEHPAVKPGDEGVKPTVGSIRLKQAKVFTPLWVHDESGLKVELKSVPVTISATSVKQGPDATGKMAISFLNDTSQGHLPEVSNQVLAAVKLLHGNLPKDATASIVVGKAGEYLFARNHNSISGAEAVLVDAILRGEEPDATVIGVIEADGSFKSPPLFWDSLRSLSDGPGGRLVIPRECAPLMLSVLAMEDPGFFFKYEVICASNLKELVERAAKRSTAPLDDASVKFHEVHEKIGTSTVGAFVANRFVRQRLAEIVQTFPDHLSAKMLAIQGSGERPSRLARPILAAEIRKAVQPAFRLTLKSYAQVDIDMVESTYEDCKKSLEALARYEEIRDRPLADRANEMLTSIRAFLRVKRALRSASEISRGESTGITTFEAMVKNINSYQRELMLELGEAPPQNPGQN